MPVAMKFRNGFPLNWLEVIEEYYVCLERYFFGGADKQL